MGKRKLITADQRVVAFKNNNLTYKFNLLSLVFYWSLYAFSFSVIYYSKKQNGPKENCFQETARILRTMNLITCTSKGE